MLPTAKAVLYCCVPLPLLLKESSASGITISPGFPTALLLTILLLRVFVQLAACPTCRSIKGLTGWVFSRSHIYEFLQGRYCFAGRAQSLSSGFGEHCGKYCNPGKMLPQRGSRQQVVPGVGDPAPAGGMLATLDASPGKPGSCANASLACPKRGRAARHDKTFCLWLLAGKLAPKKHLLQGEFPWFTKHCHRVTAAVPSKAHFSCLDAVSVTEQCCWHLSPGLTGDLWTPQQNNTLPRIFYCHTTMMHFVIPCTEHWLCWLSAYFLDLSPKHCCTLILSSLIFAYPPWFEGYLNRSLLLKTQICMSDYAKSC